MAAAALEAINQAVRDAQDPHPARPRDRLEPSPDSGPAPALAALVMLRRQAAERRYLRLRPGTAGRTGEQRVQDTHDQRNT
ncbi:hypothetical protein AB0D54_26085 [Streptomyces xanthophaeus]|uniref:hypothetical protein n=1 Tax=Streptomyces xanthophaeus TaxID=67385 RepID=UPI0034245BB4